MTNESYSKRLSAYQARAVIDALALEELEREAHDEAWDRALGAYLRLHQAVLDKAIDAHLVGVPWDEFKKELVAWFQ